MICILGASASGKTTLAKALCGVRPYHRIVTYTTRPMRAGEVDGVDYHFVSQEKFEAMRKAGLMAETGEYRGWQYGTAKQDCDEYGVVVVTPRGLRNLRKNPDLHIFSFYLMVPLRDRLIKSLLTRDDIDECIRRSQSDVGQFDGVEDEVDYVLHNAGYAKTPRRLAEEILYILD